MKNFIFFKFFIFLYFLGCAMPVPEHWLVNLKSPVSDGNTSPVTVAIIVNDQRPAYNPSAGALSVVPLVPYAKGTGGGIPFICSAEPPGTLTTSLSIALADFKDLIPLLIARAIRDSKTVIHAGYVENDHLKNQYEVVLELKMNDVYYEEGLIFYGLSLPGDLFWLLGAPAGIVGMRANIDWKLYVQSSGEILNQGTYTFSDTGRLLSLYYGGGNLPNAKTNLEKDFFPKLIEYFVTEIRKPLKQRSRDYWVSLVNQHTQWRIARGETPLPVSIAQGEKNKIIRQQPISEQKKNKYNEIDLVTPSFNGELEVVKLLIEKGADVNAKNKDGGIPLIYAASKGYIEIVRLLIEKGADVNAKTGEGSTALDRALTLGRLEIAKLLIEKGADVNAKDKYGWTFLTGAVSDGNIKVVRLLIEKGADVNAKDGRGNTALPYAISRGHSELARFLIEKGADVNAKDKDDCTPLMKSAMKGLIEIVRLLIEKGVDVNAKTGKGNTALPYALLEGHSEIVKLLIEKGAVMPNVGDVVGEIYLSNALNKGHSEVARLLIERGANVNAKDKDDCTPLMKSAMKGLIEIVRLLIEKGADVNAKDKDEWTSLIFAAGGDHIEIAKLLIEKGADVNAKTKKGNTALSYAVSQGHSELARFLIEKGTDIKGKAGEIYLTLAKNKNDNDIIKILEQFIEKLDIYKEEYTNIAQKEKNNNYDPKNNGEVLGKYYIEWVLYVLKMEVTRQEKIYLIQWASHLLEKKIEGIYNISQAEIEQKTKKSYDISKFTDIREDDQKRADFRRMLETNEVPITITAIEEALYEFRKNR